MSTPERDAVSTRRDDRIRGLLATGPDADRRYRDALDATRVALMRDDIRKGILPR